MILVSPIRSVEFLKVVLLAMKKSFSQTGASQRENLTECTILQLPPQKAFRRSTKTLRRRDRQPRPTYVIQVNLLLFKFMWPSILVLSRVG